MPDWVRLKEGYFCVAQANSVNVTCFRDTPQELAFQLILNWQTEAGCQTAYVYIDENKCVVNRACIRQDVDHDVKHYEFLTLCPVRMLKFARQEAEFKITERTRKDLAYVAKKNVFLKDGLKRPAALVLIVCFLIWLFLNANIDLSIFSFFLIRKKIKLWLKLAAIGQTSSNPCKRVLRLLEVGGLRHLDQERKTDQPGIILLDKSIKIYAAFFVATLCFLYLELGFYWRYLILLIGYLLCRAYFELICHYHVSGKVVLEAASLPVSAHGVLNLLDRSERYEKENVIKSRVFPSFFNPRLGIDHQHVVLTVSWSKKKHTSLFAEMYNGDNRLQTFKFDYGFNSKNGLGCVGGFLEQIEMVVSNRQTRAIVGFKKMGCLQKREGCKTRSVVVSRASYRKLFINLELLSTDPGYQIRDSNCLLLTLRLLDSIDVLPIDLRQEMDGFVPGRSVRFRTNDYFKQYESAAYARPLLR